MIIEKILILGIFFFTIGVNCQGQSAQFRYRVYVEGNHSVKQDIETPNADTIKLGLGVIVSSQRKFKINDVDYIADIKDTLKSSTTFYGTKIITVSKKLPGWATVAIDKDDKSKININYWLGSNYDLSGKYYIKLKNRDFVKFWFNSIEGGALTIPFKYRPEFRKNNIDISDQFTADLNVGAYLGYTFGQITYTYRKGDDKDPYKWLISVGPFLSISRIEIDSLVTLSSTEPLKQKIAIATISPGIGIMTSVYDFRLGIFLGNDLAIGGIAQQWDYGNKWWWGFGFGYNVGLLWNTKK